MKDKKYSAVLNIIEDDPSEYYSDTNLKYRVIGTLKIDGEDKKIDARLNSTIDKIYIEGQSFQIYTLKEDTKLTIFQMELLNLIK